MSHSDGAAGGIGVAGGVAASGAGGTGVAAAGGAGAGGAGGAGCAGLAGGFSPSGCHQDGRDAAVCEPSQSGGGVGFSDPAPGSFFSSDSLMSSTSSRPGGGCNRRPG